jgi:hypothetical protein
VGAGGPCGWGVFAEKSAVVEPSALAERSASKGHVASKQPHSNTRSRALPLFAHHVLTTTSR